MRNGIRVKSVTWRKGLFGIREVIRRRTIPAAGGGRAGAGKTKWNPLVTSEAERLAALYLMWEEEKADGQGKERLER